MLKECSNCVTVVPIECTMCQNVVARNKVCVNREFLSCDSLIGKLLLVKMQCHVLSSFLVIFFCFLIIVTTITFVGFIHKRFIPNAMYRITKIT